MRRNDLRLQNVALRRFFQIFKGPVRLEYSDISESPEEFFRARRIFSKIELWPNPFGFGGPPSRFLSPPSFIIIASVPPSNQSLEKNLQNA